VSSSSGVHYNFVYMFLNANRATGIGFLHWEGFVLMGVGFLYFVFGLFLTRSFILLQ
jgi:hypothetical protein